MNKPVAGTEVIGLFSQWAGGHARIWQFGISHRRMVIRVEWTEREDCLEIFASGCRHMKGPFSWESARFEIASRYDADVLLTLFTLADSKAGFELCCEGVTAVIKPVESC
jgi:hypothetical protein